MIEEQQWVHSIKYDVLSFDKHEDYMDKLFEFIKRKLKESSNHELTLNTLFEGPDGATLEYKSFRNIFESQHTGIGFLNDSILNRILKREDSFFPYFINKKIITDKIYIVSIYKALILMDEKNFNEFNSNENMFGYFNCSIL